MEALRLEFWLLQIAMSNHLKTLEVYHISTIPKRRLTRDQLLAVLQDEQAVENLFQDLRTSLGRTHSQHASGHIIVA